MQSLRKTPVLIWAILFGLAVQIVGIMPFGMLMQVNMQTRPDVPWAVGAEILILALLFMFVAGVIGPKGTATARRRYLRLNAIPAPLLPQTMITATAFGSTIILLSVHGFLLLPYPPETSAMFEAMLDMPRTTALWLLMGMAIATGIVEEAAYRGIMQVPLEERYGPFFAILVVAIVFALSHPLPTVIIPLFIVGSMGWGLLSRLTNSTLPGMVAHAAVDGSLFLWILFSPDQFRALLASNVLEDGSTPVYLTVSVLLAISILVSIWSFLRLWKLKKAQ